MGEDKALEEIYTRRFFARRHKLSWRAPIVVGAICDALNPKSVVDAGCATGDLVAEFVNSGIPAFGIEGSSACLEFLECSASRVMIADLGKPFPGGYAWGRYDLAISLEVAEHVEPECAEQYVRNLTALSDRVLMSAAHPGQGGHHHVNCQYPSYWEGHFMNRNYRRGMLVETNIRNALAPWRHKAGVKAYWMNLLYFERTACTEKAQ